MKTDEEVSLFGYGFIGREFVRQFPDTVVVDRDSNYSPTENILYGISTIHNYHPKEGDLFMDVETNLIKFLTVLQANQDRDIVFNLISSWFSYGQTEKLPASEDDLCNPTGFYSVTAYAREKLLESYCKTFDIKYRILRLGNVIGIGDEKASPKKNALQWMISELAKGNEVKLYKGDAIRDYIDVRDCVRAINLVLEKGEYNTIYNISNGQGLRVSRLLETANRAVNFKGKIGQAEVPDFHKIVQTPKMWLNTKRLESLGYVKQHDIMTTVEELAKFYELEG
jgi:nucleoside-diphosphate-sugar epimerase